MKHTKYSPSQFNNFYACSFCGAWTRSDYGIKFNAETIDWSFVGTMGACPQCAKEFITPIMETLETATKTKIPIRNRYKKKTAEINKMFAHIYDTCVPVLRWDEKE